MLRTIFTKSLFDQRRSLLWWALGLLLLATTVMGFYPSIQTMPDLNRFMEMAPKELLAAFVGNLTDLTSPTGYLSSQIYFFLAPLLFLIYAIGQGSAATAGEEERGTLELLLANPLPRSRVVLEKFAAFALVTLGWGLLLWGALAAGAALVDMPIALSKLAAVTFSAVLLALAFGALALAVGCATGSRGAGLGIAGAAAFAAYLFNALAPMVKALEPYRKLSPFYYYIGADPLVNGLNAGHAAVLAGLAAAGLIAALWAFDRRDLRV